jgi:hypothetical protein
MKYYTPATSCSILYRSFSKERAVGMMQLKVTGKEKIGPIIYDIGYSGAVYVIYIKR